MALSPEQIEKLQNKTQAITSELTEWLLKDICRRVCEAGQFTGTAEYQLWRLKMLSVSKATIRRELRKRLHITQAELDELIKQSAEDGYKFDVNILKTEAPKFADNEAMQQIMMSAVELADDNFNNITQTLGLVLPNGNAGTLTQAYQKCCDFAHMQVATGATDYATAVKNATRNLLRAGVRSIDYASGKHRSVESAVRGAVIGGIGLMQEQISEHNHKELGANGWEISAHEMSAPDHEPIQGRQYTDEEYQKLNASLKRRIGTLNCKHIAFPIIIGVSKPIYTEELLQEMARRNADGVNYNGRHYSLYEATQQQRALERSIRATKKQILLAEAVKDVSGDDTLYSTLKTKLTVLNAEYNRFSKAVNLRPQYSRTQIGVNVS